MHKILLITSSGGGGLLLSATAKEQEIKQQDPLAKIIRKDLLLDWMGPVIGGFGRWYYNWAQKNGRVFWQNLLVRCNLYADKLFFPFIFYRTLKVLLEEEIDEVIDNQPVGTSAIIKAVRCYNYWKKKHLKLEKILVDLPTRHYRFLLKSLKNLSKKDKTYLRLVTIEPLLETDQSEADFWKKYAGLKLEQIVYEKYVIRTPFKKLMGKRREHKTCPIKIRVSSEPEKNFFERFLACNSSPVQRLFDGYEFLINPEDRLIVLLLGSQPARNATYQYVEKIMQLVQSRSEHYYLFVFADRFKHQKNNLFARLFLLCANKPKNLSLVPMSFQEDETIANLFHRSDLTLTRSGGHTIMELMAVAKREKWIHSEAKKSESL
ncbi:MAG: hypothetical protein WC371_04770, partial [Parachlamydiales bacterium]